MFSYWERRTFFYPRDVVICGAGFTGLSAAIYYKRSHPHKTVLVLEKDALNGGASTKNAGFACFGSPSELIADLRKSDEDQVFYLVSERIRGLKNLRTLLGDEAIDYKPFHGYELFRFDDPLYPECVDKMDYLNEKVKTITGEAVYFPADEKISVFGYSGIAHIIENTAEGQVDTGRMYASLLTLARESGVEVFNGIEVTNYQDSGPVTVCTNYGDINCDRFLIATNGFAGQLLAESQTVPARAQVLITTPVDGLRVRGSFHMDEGFYYFRNVGNRVLLGGGRNLDFAAETTTDLQLNKNIQYQLEKMLDEIILPAQDYRIDQRWSGIMGMGPEKQIIRRQLSENTFCAIRLSGMGLALSTLLGKEAAKMME